MKNKIVIAVISIIAIFGFLLLVYKLINPQREEISQEVNTINPNDHLKWSPEKKNILVEYSDFQCPACKNFHSILSTFEASTSPDFQITKKVTLVYRHFPLPQHTNAMMAAYAAEAAGKQGKFFEMADIIFEKQEEWSNLADSKDYFINLAKRIDLNLEKFKKDLEVKEVKEKIDADLISGQKANINATPTFFLNGKKLEISSFSEFKKLLLSL